MPDYFYKARDNEGRLTTGTLRASGTEQAGVMLRNEGKFIVAIEPAKAGVADAEAAPRRGRVKSADVISFAHQLAVMIDTGVPISEAMDCVTEQTASPAFKAVLEDVAKHVKSGGELSAALAQHGRVFPSIMISLIRASEASGTMGAMLERISSYMAKEAQTRRTVRGALTYPAVMLTMVLLVTVFLLAFVMPRFADVYQQRDAALPAPTQMLMTFSDLMVNYWYAWIGLAIAAAVGLALGVRTEAGKRLIDWLKLHIPVLGPIFRKLYVTRGCRTMGTMLAAGVPILDMVQIVRDVTVNRYYEDLWDDVDERLQRGSQLSDALFDSPLFPRSVSQMIYAGEKSGRLSSTLEKIAHFTEEEFDAQVKQSTQYLEPALVVAMGSIIGFVAIALLLPIFSVSSTMG
jgi:type IV pilus assembly protein PilC